MKYEVGIEFTPNADVKSTHGLVGGRQINDVRSKITLNKTRNTYVKVIFDKNDRVIEIWKLTKKEYNNLHCGFGQAYKFAEFLNELI